eukprot:CAMPEP_0202884894 /NCGR_PEP_ID=MMETSP1391-20130828/41383_1 /ASSEMBLY_ACC=CAM_ASM_000867 /TAXON_ID=1034604 /ORGANISM="Chlamydomonas leiostraca, Strain SAG 11-49" /LENGTH=560 /DNA_ID=CAMNT_0049568127 /DNA_START=54 /DNA_END=1733 /DNA_ORIENTATION=+
MTTCAAIRPAPASEPLERFLDSRNQLNLAQASLMAAEAGACSDPCSNGNWPELKQRDRPARSSSELSVEPAAKATISLMNSKWDLAPAGTDRSSDDEAGPVCCAIDDACLTSRQCSSAGALGAASPHQEEAASGRALPSRNALSGENTVPTTPRTSQTNLGAQLSAACSLLGSLALAYRSEDGSGSEPSSGVQSKPATPSASVQPPENPLALPPALVPCSSSEQDNVQGAATHSAHCMPPSPSHGDHQAREWQEDDASTSEHSRLQQDGCTLTGDGPSPSVPAGESKLRALNPCAAPFSARPPSFSDLPTCCSEQQWDGGHEYDPSYAGADCSGADPSSSQQAPREVPTLYIPAHVPEQPPDDEEEVEEQQYEEEEEEEEEPPPRLAAEYLYQAGMQVPAQQQQQEWSEAGAEAAVPLVPSQQPVKALLPVQGMVNVGGQMMVMEQLLPMQLVSMGGQMVWVPCSMLEGQAPVQPQAMYAQPQPAVYQQHAMAYQQPAAVYQQQQVVFQQPVYHQPAAYQQPVPWQYQAPPPPSNLTASVYTVQHPGQKDGGLAAAKPAW